MKNNFFTYDTVKFTDVWDNVESFITDYGDVGIPKSIEDSYAMTLFYLLYARYGNNTIAFTDVNQFKYNVFTIMFMYGPTWEERLKLQEKIRKLSDDELLQGGKAIYNTALNPSNKGSTQQLEELDYINSQNTTNYKKSKMEAYALKWDLLDTDVTSEFLGKFKALFRKILDPERPVLYETYILEGDNE